MSSRKASLRRKPTKSEPQDDSLIPRELPGGSGTNMRSGAEFNKEGAKKAVAESVKELLNACQLSGHIERDLYKTICRRVTQLFIANLSPSEKEKWGVGNSISLDTEQLERLRKLVGADVSNTPNRTDNHDSVQGAQNGVFTPQRRQSARILSKHINSLLGNEIGITTMNAQANTEAKAALNPVSQPPESDGDEGEEHQWTTRLKQSKTCEHVLLVDLDNWPNFFQSLPFSLPASVFVAAYYRRDSPSIRKGEVEAATSSLKQDGRLLLIEGMQVKDSADSLLIMKAQSLALNLPKSTWLTIVSNDAIFRQTQAELRRQGRAVLRIGSRNHSDLAVVLEACGINLPGEKGGQNLRLPTDALGGGGPRSPSPRAPKRPRRGKMQDSEFPFGYSENTNGWNNHNGGPPRVPQSPRPEGGRASLESVTSTHSLTYGVYGDTPEFPAQQQGGLLSTQSTSFLAPPSPHLQGPGSFGQLRPPPSPQMAPPRSPHLGLAPPEFPPAPLSPRGPSTAPFFPLAPPSPQFFGGPMRAPPSPNG